ncbi:MAG TPA: hypothetical protein VH257_04260, partial [Chloroflexota bacterium]|nr:hypothetical protein [Chloroflexota bacterium]
LFEAGTFLIGAGRLLMLVALFLLFESVSRSARVAGLASLLYMANPNFVFFGAQYSYESLALPLATLALLAARRWARAAGGPAEGVAWALAFCGALWATVMTHHLTAYALAGFLVLWLLACLWRARGPASGRRETLVAATAAALGVGASLAWLLSAGSATFGYLAPVLSGGVADLAGWIAGQTQLRRLFSDFAGQRSPLWEQLLGYVAVGLILLGLPFGLLQIWRRHRAEAMAVALGVVVLAYPVTLALRLTERGAETSNRSSEFLFVGIAFVLALAAVERWLPPQRLPVALPAGGVEVLSGALATLLFAGGVIVGWGPLARLPGPYLMGTDTRSIEAQGVAGAHTLLRLLGPGNRLAADRTNRLLLGSYGRQRPVSAFADWVGVAPLYFSSEVGPAEREILRRGRIRYVVVDRRLGSGLPPVGVFVELGEANTNRHTAPITPGALAKFDTVQGVGRIYDSGDIVVYDVEALQR